MPATIEYPALVSETVLFANKAAAEAFFDNFEVPDATTADEGVFLQAEAVAYNFVPLVVATTVVINLDGVQEDTVPTQAAFAELKASYVTLATAFDLLLQKLEAAGILDT